MGILFKIGVGWFTQIRSCYTNKVLKGQAKMLLYISENNTWFIKIQRSSYRLEKKIKKNFKIVKYKVYVHTFDKEVTN